MSVERFGRFASCFYQFCWRQRSVPTMMAKSIDIGSADMVTTTIMGKNTLSQ
jgi:hypothetical protein